MIAEAVLAAQAAQAAKTAADEERARQLIDQGLELRREAAWARSAATKLEERAAPDLDGARAVEWTGLGADAFQRLAAELAVSLPVIAGDLRLAATLLEAAADTVAAEAAELLA